MILRRLAEGVRQQDWFTVVVEVLIVVVGIFLGLQVDGWNKARQDRLLEQEYLERIIDTPEVIQRVVLDYIGAKMALARLERTIEAE